MDRFVRTQFFIVLFVLLTTLVFLGECTPSTNSTARWISSSESVNTTTTELVAAGNMTGASTCFIARVPFFGGVLPGCGLESRGGIRFTLGYRRPVLLERNSYEYLVHGVVGEDSLKWVGWTSMHAAPPGNAVKGGNLPVTGEELYICREWNDSNHLAVGWLTRSGKRCIIPQGGPAIPFNIYQVLVHNNNNGTEQVTLNSSGSPQPPPPLDIFQLANQLGGLTALPNQTATSTSS